MRRLLMLTALASLVLAAFLSTNRTTATAIVPDAEHVRWDIIHLTPGPGGVGATVNSGGQASAKDNIGDTITFTGSGTFVAPSGGGGTSSAVTGGGDWTITTAAGGSGGNGMYTVKGLVRWEEAPGTFP